MHIAIRPLAVPFLLLASLAHADEAADLRAENARLHTQLEALQKSCPVAAATSNPATGTIAPTSPAPIAATTIAPAATVDAAAPTPANAAAPPAAPPGYKLVRVAPLPPSERYMDTGCSRGLFQGPAPAQWLDVNAWESLQKGMGPNEVEALIGIEHHDVEGRGKLQWQYGRCGDSIGGWVLFEDGRVRSWSAPER